MASNITFKINGVDVTLSNGFGGIDLIMSHDAILKIDAQKFFGAMKVANENLNHIENIFWLEEYPGLGYGAPEIQKLNSIIFDNPFATEEIKLQAQQELNNINRPQIVESKNMPLRKRISGYVYFLSGNGFYKIGKTIILKKRITWYTINLPFKCSLEHAISSNDYAKCESHFHQKFKDKNVNGEWFVLNTNDLLAIKKIEVLNF